MIFATTTIPRNQALGASLLSAYSWLSMALALAQMVLVVWKNNKPTQFYMLNNLGFNNFPKKLIPGDVRDQILREPVGASYTEQGQESGTHVHFWTLEVKPDGTPHLGLGPCHSPGRCSNI